MQKRVGIMLAYAKGVGILLADTDDCDFLYWQIWTNAVRPIWTSAPRTPTALTRTAPTPASACLDSKETDLLNAQVNSQFNVSTNRYKSSRPCNSINY